MSPLTRQQQPLALAIAIEQRGTPEGLALSEALAANSQGWVRDVMRIESAKAHFYIQHFKQAVRGCEVIIDGTDENDLIHARALLLRARATMALETFDANQFSDVEGWLDDAMGVFEAARDARRIGKTLRAQGVLAVWQGDVEKGPELIAVGERLEGSFTVAGAPPRTPSARTITQLGQ